MVRRDTLPYPSGAVINAPLPTTPTNQPMNQNLKHKFNPPLLFLLLLLLLSSCLGRVEVEVEGRSERTERCKQWGSAAARRQQAGSWTTTSRAWASHGCTTTCSTPTSGPAPASPCTPSRDGRAPTRTP